MCRLAGSISVMLVVVVAAIIGGSPNPQIVWGNGKKAWQGRRNNGFHPDADRVTVRLNAGRNEIVVASNFMMFLGVHPK